MKISTRPSTAFQMPDRCTLRGWNTTSPSDRMTVGPSLPEFFEHLERIRIEPVGERIVDQELRHRKQPVRRLAVLFEVGAVALQRAEIVGIAEFLPELLEMRPVKLAGLAELAGQVLAQIVGDAVVVEQRVVDIQKKDDVVLHVRPRSKCARS